MSGEGRIPLTVVGGFLGSGKTTWLRHQLHRGRMQNALVIVNEAADVPVDDMLLLKSTEVRALAGGCACCDGRDALLALLRDFCDRRVDRAVDGPRHGHLVLETSGLADPGPIVEAIRGDPVLTHHIVVREIIVAVDALHGLAYLKTEPLGLRQAETADRLVITKADLATTEALRRLRATLERLNPGAALSAAAMGSAVDLPPVGDAVPDDLPAAAGAGGAPMVSTTLRLGPGSDWTAFGVWLSAMLHVHGDDLVRVKGVLRTPSGRLLLQSVRRVVQSPEVLPEAVSRSKDENCLVFIGRGIRARDLALSMRNFAGLKVEAGPAQVAVAEAAAQ